MFFIPTPILKRPRKSADDDSSILRRRALHTPHAHMQERDRSSTSKKGEKKGKEEKTRKERTKKHTRPNLA